MFLERFVKAHEQPNPPRRLASGRVDAQLLRFINPFLPSPWEGDLSPSLPFPVASGRSVAGRLERGRTPFFQYLWPSESLWARLFPIFHDIFRNFSKTWTKTQPPSYVLLNMKDPRTRSRDGVVLIVPTETRSVAFQWCVLVSAACNL